MEELCDGVPDFRLAFRQFLGEVFRGYPYRPRKTVACNGKTSCPEEIRQSAALVFLAVWNATFE